MLAGLIGPKNATGSSGGVLTLCATTEGTERNEMPPPCAVEFYVINVRTQ